MARQRMIKPKFWDDSKIKKLKRDVRLLYIGMWNFSDDAGCIISEPIWLKSKIFPYDTDIQLSQFEKWLTDLETLGFIRRLHYNNEGIFYLPNFSRHQTINRPNVDELLIPESELESVLEESLINHGIISDESRPKIREDKTSKKEDKEPEIIFPFLSTDFKDLWDNWKIYRKKEFKKTYKTVQSEQAALKNVCKLAGGNEETAKEIIMQSIANQWQGLFEIKNKKNEKSTGKVDNQQVNTAFAKFYSQEQPARTG